MDIEQPEKLFDKIVWNVFEKFYSSWTEKLFAKGVLFRSTNTLQKSRFLKIEPLQSLRVDTNAKYITDE